jgi:hypothetical protein
MGEVLAAFELIDFAEARLGAPLFPNISKEIDGVAGQNYWRFIPYQCECGAR